MNHKEKQMNHWKDEMKMGFLASVVMTAGLCVAGEGKRPMGLLMMWDGTRAEANDNQS